jgi:hypothetical protein
MLFPKTTMRQFWLEGNVLAVHVIPSKLVAATLLAVSHTATKALFPKATEVQSALEGSVLAVQVIPSGDEAAAVPPAATATKMPFP